jgi:hypothetical protein
MAGCLFIERNANPPFYFLFFSGARSRAGHQLSAMGRAPLKNRKEDLPTFTHLAEARC